MQGVYSGEQVFILVTAPDKTMYGYGFSPKSDAKQVRDFILAVLEGRPHNWPP